MPPILATPGQLLKIKRSIAANKNVLTLRMSRKQVKLNINHEGGFFIYTIKSSYKSPSDNLIWYIQWCVVRFG